MRLAPIALLLSSSLAALLPAPAHAQVRVFCCDDGQGKRICSDFLPPECTKRPYEERDDKGFVVSRKEAPPSPEQIARREAEIAKKNEEARLKAEARRRDLALLSTYSEEKDIDRARERVIAEIQKNVVEAEKQLEAAQKDRAKAEKEKEFYKNRSLPPEVKKLIGDSEANFKKKQEDLAGRKAEIERAKVRFDEEKRKFRELKGIVTPGPALVAPLAPEIPQPPSTPGAPGTPGSTGAPPAPPVPPAAR